MKKIMSLVLVLAMSAFNAMPLFAATAQPKKASTSKVANEMKFAFVFDGPSDKNNKVLEY